MAKIGIISLTGKGGTQYAFNIWARSDRFKAIGVIYVMAKDDGSSYHLIYIGETGDASQRPFNHERKDCFDRHGANSVFIHVEGDPTTRLRIETDLRNAYNPPCNRQ